jgi:dihydropteroate synthase
VTPHVRVGSRVISLDVPVVMGIVNVTPDSFSDGGRFLDTERAIAHGVELAAEGAAIVDVGGESTRPNAEPVALDDELRRVIPVVSGLVDRGLVVSVDTRRAVVARRALEHGASIINDVSGLRDPAMRAVVAEFGVAAIVMHMPVDDPKTMQRHATYTDVVSDVHNFLRRQIEVARADGIEQIVVDPGIGFGKTTAHNLALINGLDAIVGLGCPVLVGASRKRFVGEITGVERAELRLAGTLTAHLAALDHGAKIVRVHDVCEHVEAIRMWQALRAN